jgi:hypothetical protein
LLKLQILGDAILRRRMSGGVEWIHLLIEPAHIRSPWSHLSTSAVPPTRLE